MIVACYIPMFFTFAFSGRIYTFSYYRDLRPCQPTSLSYLVRDDHNILYMHVQFSRQGKSESRTFCVTAVITYWAVPLERDCSETPREGTRANTSRCRCLRLVGWGPVGNISRPHQEKPYLLQRHKRQIYYIISLAVPVLRPGTARPSQPKAKASQPKPTARSQPQRPQVKVSPDSELAHRS